MKKYYIEITDLDSGDYIVQSEFFDSEEQAVKWAEKIEYIREQYVIDLMCCEWYEDDHYGDIDFVRTLRKGE